MQFSARQFSPGTSLVARPCESHGRPWRCACSRIELSATADCILVRKGRKGRKGDQLQHLHDLWHLLFLRPLRPFATFASPITGLSFDTDIRSKNQRVGDCSVKVLVAPAGALVRASNCGRSRPVLCPQRTQRTQREPGRELPCGNPLVPAPLISWRCFPLRPLRPLRIKCLYSVNYDMFGDSGLCPRRYARSDPAIAGRAAPCIQRCHGSALAHHMTCARWQHVAMSLPEFTPEPRPGRRSGWRVGRRSRATRYW